MHCGGLSARKSKEEEIKVNAWLTQLCSTAETNNIVQQLHPDKN